MCGRRGGACGCGPGDRRPRSAGRTQGVHSAGATDSPVARLRARRRHGRGVRADWALPSLALLIERLRPRLIRSGRVAPEPIRDARQHHRRLRQYLRRPLPSDHPALCARVLDLRRSGNAHRHAITAAGHIGDSRACLRPLPPASRTGARHDGGLRAVLGHAADCVVRRARSRVCAGAHRERGARARSPAMGMAVAMERAADAGQGRPDSDRNRPRRVRGGHRRSPPRIVARGCGRPVVPDSCSAS